MTVHYEWVVEMINADGSVEEIVHWDTYAEAVADAAQQQPNTHRVDIGLHRRTLDEDGDLLDEAWAYVHNGSLPDVFDETAGGGRLTVPQRFRREVSKHHA